MRRAKAASGPPPTLLVRVWRRACVRAWLQAGLMWVCGLGIVVQAVWRVLVYVHVYVRTYTTQGKRRMSSSPACPRLALALFWWVADVPKAGGNGSGMWRPRRTLSVAHDT